jgi:hypothetical protein
MRDSKTSPRENGAAVPKWPAIDLVWHAFPDGGCETAIPECDHIYRVSSAASLANLGEGHIHGIEAMWACAAHQM